MDYSVPPGVDLNESQHAHLYGAYISTFSLAVISVVLRLLCRKTLSKAGLWWDDWVICISLVGITYSTGRLHLTQSRPLPPATS